MHFVIRALIAVILGSVLIIPTVTHASSPNAQLPTISLAMNGKSITVSGALQSGAVDIRSKTMGEQFASPLFVRLKPGVTPQQFFAFLRSPQSRDINHVSQVGSIVLDAGAPRGISDVQTVLRPGQYIAFDAAQQENRPPTTWPRTTFTVTRAAQPVALPTPRATIRIIDFAFRGPATLHNGEVVRVVNNGDVVHMADAFGVPSLETANRVVHLLQAGKDKKAQRLANNNFLALAGPVSHGAIQQLTLRAAPGYYVMACFMDTQDGREHARLGMARVIRIVG